MTPKIISATTLQATYKTCIVTVAAVILVAGILVSLGLTGNLSGSSSSEHTRAQRCARGCLSKRGGGSRLKCIDRCYRRERCPPPRQCPSTDLINTSRGLERRG